MEHAGHRAMKAHGFKVREAWLPLVFFNLQSGLSLLLITWTIAEQLEHAAAAGTTRYLVAGESCQVADCPLAPVTWPSVMDFNTQDLANRQLVGVSAIRAYCQ